MYVLKNIAAAALVLLAVAAPAEAQSRLDRILEEGVLRVGVTGDWNPMSVRDPATNEYRGFDIDVMTQLAADLEVELEFVPTTWPTLVNGIVAGNYDITGSASISAARLRAAGFSQSYIQVEIFPFTTSDKIDRFDGWDSINQPDVRVAATLGTTFERYVREWFPNAEIVIVDAPVLGHQEVLAGRADVFVTSNIEGATLIAEFPNVAQIPVDGSRAPSPIAMLLPRDDQVWINYVNSWITIQETRGFFEEVAARYGL